MIIKVTQDHIRRGTPCEQSSCPIALAMIDAGLRWVKVSLYECSHVVSGKRLYHDLPEMASEFVGAFDFIGKVTPFEFEIPYEP